MPNEDKTSYDLLLEDNKKMHEELENLKTKVNDFYDFAKSMLNSRSGTSKSENEESEDLLKKLKEEISK